MEQDSSGHREGQSAESEPGIDAYLERLRALVDMFGLDHSPAALRLAAVALGYDAMNTAAEVYRDTRLATEQERVKGQRDTELAIVRAEEARARDVERTRLWTLAAITAVTLACVASVYFIDGAKLTDSAAVIAAFAGLVRLVVGDPAPPQAQPGEHRRGTE